MEADQNDSVKGDRALGRAEDDKLGFRDVAGRIATSLVYRASDDSLVIGVEGAWGSGKSSLLFLLRDELRKLQKDRPHSVIDFRPWLVGDRDALIKSLFDELSSQLDQVASDKGSEARRSITKAKKAFKEFRKVVSRLERVGAAIAVMGDVLALPFVPVVGKVIKAAGDAAKKPATPPPLSELKDKLANSLRELKHRFIVTIDDVDRLEPAEVIEILRLVRSVVDLPNVIYLLCYDSEILAHSIETATGVKNGQSYLEKIVQLTVMVPKPEEMHLRQWFADDLRRIAEPKDDDELSRLRTVIDSEGSRQLRTPRSVIRALDAVRFFWPPLRDAKADLADLVWLQLIKNGNPALYRWIEGYCATAAVVSLGAARVEEAEIADQFAALHKAVGAGYFDDPTYRFNFVEQLPGMEAYIADEENSIKIFQPVANKKRDMAIRTNRLASPDHYRLYFALSAPSHTLTQADFTSIWAAADSCVEQAGVALLGLHAEPAAGSLSKANILLERIKGGVFKALTPEQCADLLLALSQVMDQAYRQRPLEFGSVYSLWFQAERLIPTFLEQLEPTQRCTVVKAMFSEGAAIGWLTSIFRHERAAHGRYGNSLRPESAWLFTDVELDAISAMILSRYEAMSAKDVFACPVPLDLLFAWRQGGDEQGPRALIEANIVSAEDLVETLEHMISITVSSNRGKYDVLTKNNLDPFMNYDDVAQRVHELKDHTVLGVRAARLAGAFDNAAYF